MSLKSPSWGRRPSRTSRIVGYRYDGTILDLSRMETLLRRAQETGHVIQYVAKQYGDRGKGR